MSPVGGAKEVYQALQVKALSETSKTKTFEWYKLLLAKDRRLFTKTVVQKVINE